MSITGILIAAAIVGGTGLFIGVFLGIAGKKLAVEVDERETAILDVLPGNNCGGCGFAGCAGLATAIVEGTAEPNGCPVGGAAVAAKIGEIMGLDVGDQVRMVAYVKCSGNDENAGRQYDYYGIEDCAMMDFVQNGGPMSCHHGCHGYGECVENCGFDAIHVINGVSVVDKEACKGCGKCVDACPRHLIELIPYDQKYMVRCSSREKGKDVMSVCKAGCIGCKLCERNCEAGAVTVENNMAHIDPEKCTGCGVCAEKCPRKVIISL